MQAFDLLTEKDLDYIKQYIAAYGGYNGDDLCCSIDLDNLLRFWNGSKSGFLSTLMGNKLILEREIDIAVPESILWEEMEEAIYPDSNGVEFVDNFYHWANTLNYSEYELVTRLVSLEALVSNIYEGDSFELNVPDKKHPLQINRGCKAMKILGKIAQLFNIGGFEDFRLKHSMVLNQKKFRGTLCLSIHPLDYMTMSDNDCNWDSCMSWQKPGEYREGTVEMMNSPHIVIAYLKAEEDMQLFSYGNKDYIWNNKRWRKLYVVTPDVISGIKGYPYNDRILESEVFKWFMELAQVNCPWCHYDAPIEYEAGEPFEYHGVKMQIWYKFKIMYDDFYSKHIGYFSPTILKKLDEHDVYELMLSGPTMCLECGSAWEDVKNWDTQSLLCPDCTGEIKCNECGDFIFLESAYEVDGNYMCPYCVESQTNRCSYCDELHYRENTTPIYAVHNDNILLDECFYVCDDCMKDTESVNKAYGEIRKLPHPRRTWYGHVHTIDTAVMTLEGFRAFGCYFADTVEEARAQFD